MGKNKVHRIEIDHKDKSSEAKIIQKKLKSAGFDSNVEISAVYTIEYDFPEKKLRKIADSLANPIVQGSRIDSPAKNRFDFAIELGFLPGVTDNVANTAREIINDLFKEDIGINKVFTSRLIFITCKDMSRKDAEAFAKDQINELIERFHIKSYKEYAEDKGMDYLVPKVNLDQKAKAIEVDLEVDDEELIELGKKGILDPTTRQRRGPLALSLNYLKAIREYFRKEGRNPTDIELESIAQTWSEHCKHTIFASEIDDIKEGIYKACIKSATNKIRKDLGKDDFCLSVFKDNSGAIIFDDDYMITDKAETHNSPSALDPFGGAITGIVGVNRDTIGFGMGALPIANKYGFCVGRPEDTNMIYRGKGKTNSALTPKKILDGIVHGVNVGGNCSGIPTPTGFVFFDDHYKGKPLVFVGTIGLMPRVLNDKKPGQEKKAQPGDNIVMIGGRVGKDGIHGATFSSEAMDEGSPATAVQIGDPITQKKLSDALVKEARDLGLYNSITDNGAGGLSCSVAEMAEESGGFVLDLEKVPLKYPGLQPWETWISESQERMTLSVPDSKLDQFMDLMKKRGVEATVLGRFNDTSKAIVNLEGKKIFDLDMDFLHHGLPDEKLMTEPYPYDQEEPDIKINDQQEFFEKMLASHNICSYEYISRQYDHEVQNNSVIKPLQGIGRVNGTASVIRPLLSSKKGVVMSQALFPRLSKIDCYKMAAVSIDTAIRNAVAVGADVSHMALMDNFCWCSSDDPKRLAQLKDAAKACYDYSIEYMTPFISGKDSMFNDFKGYDKKNNPIKISVLPTLMISSISVIDDIEKTCTMDLKIPEDLIYIIGKTKKELGGSEFYNLHKEYGAAAPEVDAKHAKKLYKMINSLIKKGLLSSCCSIERGGLLSAMAKKAIAGLAGAEISIEKIPAQDKMNIEEIFYSESQSRFIVSIDPAVKKAFEQEMEDFDIAEIGKVRGDDDFIIMYEDEKIIDSTVQDLEKIYKQRFEGY